MVVTKTLKRREHTQMKRKRSSHCKYHKYLIQQEKEQTEKVKNENEYKHWNGQRTKPIENLLLSVLLVFNACCCCCC